MMKTVLKYYLVIFESLIIAFIILSRMLVEQRGYANFIFLIFFAVFNCLQIIFVQKLAATMETHLQQKNCLIDEVQQQTKFLEPKPLQDSRCFQSEHQKNNVENNLQKGLQRLSRYQILLTLSIIVVLIILVYELLIHRQISMEKTDRFFNNLELLKAESAFKIKQNSLEIVKGFQKTKALDQKLAMEINLSNKENEQSYQHKQINYSSNTVLSKRAQNNQQEDKLKTVIAKQNIVKNNLLLSHKRRSNLIVGSGISEFVLQKARQRLLLLNQDKNIQKQVSSQQITYFESKYQIGKYKQLPICVVIPTYNNEVDNRYLDNIKSVVMQNYSNFHIVIIDDASTDNTGLLILKYLQSQQRVTSNRYSIIRNTQQKHTMFNLRFAASNYCKPDDIFIIVDGDDYLVGRQVFKLYNAKFQANDLWFMYTNFINTQGRIGYSRPFPLKIIQSNRYRDYPFVTSHLRAFYTKLFLNIKQEDLKDEKGEYFKAANDVAICIPVLEQAHLHIQYVPEITYFYNSNTGLNNHIIRLQEQKFNDRKIRKRHRYASLVKFM